MIPPGASNLKRVHSAYISEDEVSALCDALRLQGKPVYDENILRPRDDEDGDGPSLTGPKSDDPVYDKAVAIVAQAGYCSISHLQRQLPASATTRPPSWWSAWRRTASWARMGKAGGRRDVLIQLLRTIRNRLNRNAPQTPSSESCFAVFWRLLAGGLAATSSERHCFQDGRSRLPQGAAESTSRSRTLVPSLGSL